MTYCTQLTLSETTKTAIVILKNKTDHFHHHSSTMSWTQVYVTGLSQTNDPSDEELEGLLDARYGLSSSEDMMTWAGPGTTLIKRDKDTDACRGYAFLAFFSSQGASIAVNKINGYSRQENADEEVHDDDGLISSLLPPQLRAELSKPNAKSGRKKQTNEQGGDYSDLRLRRQRGAAVRKHPVIINSDKTKTGLGNKTR